MANILSEDLRRRVVTVLEASSWLYAAAEQFGMGGVSVIRWVKTFEVTSTVIAKPKDGDQRSHYIEAFRDVIKA